MIIRQNLTRENEDWAVSGYEFGTTVGSRSQTPAASPLMRPRRNHPGLTHTLWWPARRPQSAVLPHGMPSTFSRHILWPTSSFITSWGAATFLTHLSGFGLPLFHLQSHVVANVSKFLVCAISDLCQLHSFCCWPVMWSSRTKGVTMGERQAGSSCREEREEDKFHRGRIPNSRAALDWFIEELFSCGLEMFPLNVMVVGPLLISVHKVLRVAFLAVLILWAELYSFLSWGSELSSSCDLNLEDTSSHLRCSLSWSLESS